MHARTARRIDHHRTSQESINLPKDPKSARSLVIASVMISMFMISIEATIVSTAMPQIVAQLGGLRIPPTHSTSAEKWIVSTIVATGVFIFCHGLPQDGPMAPVQWLAGAC
jgi:hypothetical protein